MSVLDESFRVALGLSEFATLAAQRNQEQAYEVLCSLTEKRFKEHGDFPRWDRIISEMPQPNVRRIELDRDAPQARFECDPNLLEKSLRSLGPWKKGPFEIGGVTVDAEWRSDLKWARVRAFSPPLEGKSVLDVGTGNGYFLYRARGDGAKFVLGLEPSVHYVAQFLALQRLYESSGVSMLPATSTEFAHSLSVGDWRCFDMVFSMGVLYHRRSPLDHLAELKSFARPGGQVIVETIVVEGQAGYSLVPEGRYAGMSNVWFLPTVATLVTWMQKLKFVNVRASEVITTTTEEQRSTEWSTTHSLMDGLSPSNPQLTVEGHPAPRRVLVMADVP